MAPIWAPMSSASPEFAELEDYCPSGVDSQSLVSASILHALSSDYRDALIAALELGKCKVWDCRDTEEVEYYVSPAPEPSFVPAAMDVQKFWTTRVARSRVNWSAWRSTPAGEDDWVPRRVFAKSNRCQSDPTLVIGFSECALTAEARAVVARFIRRRMIAEVCWAFRHGKLVISGLSARDCTCEFFDFIDVLSRLCELRGEELRRYIIKYL